jgi:hypothetical protein
MDLVAEIAPTQIPSDDWLRQVMVERYAELLRLAFLILHDLADAEDATQLALERAWRSRAQLRSTDGALYWLRRIVVREAVGVESPDSRARTPETSTVRRGDKIERGSSRGRVRLVA